MRSLAVGQATLTQSMQIRHLLCMSSAGKPTKALRKCVSDTTAFLAFLVLSLHTVTFNFCVHS